MGTLPPPSPSHPPPAALTPQGTLRRDIEKRTSQRTPEIGISHRDERPPPPSTLPSSLPESTQNAQVASLLEKIQVCLFFFNILLYLMLGVKLTVYWQGVAGYCDEPGDDPVYPLPPSMSLHRNGGVNGGTHFAPSNNKKCSPAFSVNSSEISRDSGFSTDTSVTFEKAPIKPPFVISTPKCPPLPSGLQNGQFPSREATPTNTYEVTFSVMSSNLTQMLDPYNATTFILHPFLDFRETLF